MVISVGQMAAGMFVKQRRNCPDSGPAAVWTHEPSVLVSVRQRC